MLLKPYDYCILLVELASDMAGMPFACSGMKFLLESTLTKNFYPQVLQAEIPTVS